METDSSYVSLVVNRLGLINRAQILHFSKENGNELSSTTLFCDSSRFHTEINYGSEIIKKGDGYYLAGVVIKNKLGFPKPFFPSVFKVNNTLSTQEQVIVDSSTVSSGYVNIISNTDSSFVTTGFYYYRPQYIYNTFVKEMNTHGDLIWKKTYSMPFQCHLVPTSIKKCKDKGFLLLCKEREPYGRIPGVGVTNFRVTIIKIDSLGNEKWRKSIGTPTNYNIESSNLLSVNDSIFFIAWTDNEKLRLPSYKYENDPNENASIYLTKFNYIGNDFWTKSYRNFLDTVYYSTYNDDTIPLPQTAQVIALTKDSGVLIGGEQTLIKIDIISGELIWIRSNIKVKNDTHLIYKSHINSLVESLDGGIVLGGNYEVDRPFLGQFTYIIKADKYGCIEPGCHKEDKWYIDSLNKNKPVYSFGEVLIYPNPTNDYLTIELSNNFLEKEKNISIYLYTISGKIVKKIILNETITKINTINLQKGMYFLKIQNSNINDKTYKVIIN